MNNRFLCPNCHVEEYYFDGKTLKCPKCSQHEFESALYDSEGNVAYQELKNLKNSFFKLVFGALYNCEVEYNGKVEKTSIVPIVSDSESNKIFLLIEANYCNQYHPETIDPLMSKTFTELWDLTVKNEMHITFECPVIVGATDSLNSIISYDGWVFKNFVKVS